MSKTPIDTMLDGVKWEVVPYTRSGDRDLPHATHAGVLHLFGHELRCYRLNTGEAVFDADDFEAFWGAALTPEAEPVEGSSTPVQPSNKTASAVLPSSSESSEAA